MTLSGTYTIRRTNTFAKRTLLNLVPKPCGRLRRRPVDDRDLRPVDTAADWHVVWSSRAGKALAAISRSNKEERTTATRTETGFLPQNITGLTDHKYPNPGNCSIQQARGRRQNCQQPNRSQEVMVPGITDLCHNYSQSVLPATATHCVHWPKNCCAIKMHR